MTDLTSDKLGAEASSTRAWLALLLAVLIALLAFRVVSLWYNATDLFFDEAQYWAWSEELAAGYFSKPPVLAFLIRGFTELFGDAPWAVRLASPVVHSVTAMIVFAIGARLYDARIGFWSGFAFATLPGISFSAGIISTDVPLLMFWAAALYCLVRLIEIAAPGVLGDVSYGKTGNSASVNRSAIQPGTSGICWGIAFGVCLGLALMSKYAAVFLLLGLAIYTAATPAVRPVLRAPGLWAGLLIALCILAPNLWWNFENGGVTISHTADNANWGRQMFRPHKAAEFFGAQFGVFGPIFFGALLVLVWRAWSEGLSKEGRWLLCFCLPIIAIITLQAFLSRAHANWAATAYVAASVLVVASMVRDGAWRWLKGAIILHLAIMLALAGARAYAPQIELPSGANPFARKLGWSQIATGISADLRADKFGKLDAIVTTDREVSALMFYYLLDAIRDKNLDVKAWLPPKQKPIVKDHYQLTRSLQPQVGDGPYLVISKPGYFASVKATSRRLAKLVRKLCASAKRNIGLFLFVVDGFRDTPRP